MTAGIVISLHWLPAQTLTTVTTTSTPGVLTATGPDISLLPSLSDDQLATFADILKATPTVPAAGLPGGGNFWSLQNPNWPPLPYDSSSSTAWQMSDGGFLLNDLNVDYQALATSFAKGRKSQVRPMGMDDLSPPGDGGGSTNYDEGGGGYIPDYGTNLWIARWTMTSSNVTGIASNTIADVWYEVMTNGDLATTNWGSTGWFILGSETTNWTALPVMPVCFTNNLFFRLRSWVDDGSGLPLWWQLQYFGTTGVDPYGDPAGDGWNNLQKFQNGWDPNVFYTPPAPQVSASLNAYTSMATVSWLPSPGPVIGYIIQKSDEGVWGWGVSSNYFVSANTSSFDDDLSVDTDPYYFGLNGPEMSVNYSVFAEYAGGNSAPGSASIHNYLQTFTGLEAHLVNGPNGRLFFVFHGLPSDMKSIRVYREELLYPAVYSEYQYVADDVISTFTNGFFEIPAADVTNGICQLPDDQTAPYFLEEFAAQIIRSNGVTSAWSSYNWPYKAASLPFVDLRSQIKDNLGFLLRAAAQRRPFIFYSGSYNFIFSPPTNCVYAGVYAAASSSSQIPGFNFFKPVSDNCIYRNFVFDQNHLDPSGFLNTGIYPSLAHYYQPAVSVTNFPAYYFDVPDFLTGANTTVPSSFLTAAQTRWSFANDFSPAPLTSTNFPTGQQNYYGLPYLSAELAYVTDNQLTLQTINPGDNVPSNSILYFETAQPGYLLTGYYFARAGSDPQPESIVFSTTNTTRLMFLGVGSSLSIAGYAKFAVTNGYSWVYAYLGQYFDQAYKTDTNGVATISTTGVLSPYGDFFATDPGPAALVTMPDIDTGQRGTNVVYSYSLAVDKNHDNIMNLSFSGPDATSQSSAMVIWANNNYDRGHAVDGSDFEQDDLSEAQIANLNVPAEQKVPDCQYRTNGRPAIPCARDLEDYFRLWTPGLAALMKVLPSNYTVQLTLIGDAEIRIFRAVELDGGTNYLFDETTASSQVANSTTLYVGLLSSSSTITFPIQTNFNEHFIFCGAQTGSATIDLQILDSNQNVVADAPLCLQINDIKQMYERWTVGENVSVPPMNTATWQVDNLAYRYQTNVDNSLPYILFVHGWNMETWEKDRFAETAFKRLYWQGYHGRFGIYRWPTGNGFSGIISALTDARNYDNSESNAWASANGLLNKLTDLNALYPGQVYLMAHSMGNVVAGEALRLAGANQVVNTYVAMQGAVPAHCYDATTATRSIVPILGLGQDDGTPNRYGNYYTDGAPCYFNGSAGAETYVNFYNTNDYALSTTLWQFDQNLKPDNATTPAYHYVTPSGTHPSGFYRQSGSFQTDLFFQTNTYELFAYGDEARCYALGAQADVGGVFKVNGAYQEIDLPSVWPIDTHPKIGNEPYSAHVWHSAEFRSDNAQRWQFWYQTLHQMGLK